MSANRTIARVASGLGALALLHLAFATPTYQRPDGLPIGAAALPIAASIALAIAGCAWRTAFQRPASWLALLILGQAASLQIVDAGTRLHYQHYRPWATLPLYPLPAAILVMQLALVLGGLRSKLRVVREWIANELGTGRAIALAAALVLLSATLSENVAAYRQELVTATLVQLTALGNVVVLALSAQGTAVDALSKWFERLTGPDDATNHAGMDRFAWWCGGVATVLSAILAVTVYERHPHVQDEVKYLLQARYFANGMLAMPAPPVPDAFRLYLIDVGPRGWYSVVTPGWPMILAIGEFLRVPWLVNPVLTGVNVILLYLLARSLYDRRTARVAALLLLCSPMHIFLGMTYMAQPATLTCALLAAVLVQRTRETDGVLTAWLAGIVVGFCSIVRQLDALVLAGLLGLWAIGLGGTRLRVRAIGGLVLGTALTAAAILPYNAWFTGKGTAFPIMEYHDRLFAPNANAYGFGPDRGMGWELDPNVGHGPIDATINANLNATAMNVELLGWSIGSLLVAIAFVLAGRHGRTDRAMLVTIVAVFLAYFFNYFSGGPDFGARYWDLMTVPLLVFSARGLLTMGNRSPTASHSIARTRFLTAASALTIAMLAAFLPWQSLDKYYRYLDMRPVLRDIEQQQSFGRSLLIVRGPEYPDYASASVSNPLDLHANVPVFAHDTTLAARKALVRAYSDRPIWIVDGPTRTGDGYRVVAGPLTADEVLSGTWPR